MRGLVSKIPEKWQQPIRFCIVGGLATVIHYGVYLLLQLWIWPWVAYTMGYAVSFVINYILTNYFTFRTRPSAKNGAGFVFSHAVNYGLHIGLLELFLYIGIPNEWAPFPIFAIVIPINFFILRFFFTKLPMK
mgnify:CR=1 FL=1